MAELSPSKEVARALCSIEIASLLQRWIGRGRADAVAWDLLAEVVIFNAEELAGWAGRLTTQQTLAKLATRLEAETLGAGFSAPAPAALFEALEDARELGARAMAGHEDWPEGQASKILAFYFIIAALDEAQRRFGRPGAARMAAIALDAITPLGARQRQPAEASS